MVFPSVSAASASGRFSSVRFLAGFTLIEMLVVLMVMGLLLGLVTVSLQPDDRGRLAVEAERLAQLLNLATQEARLSGKPIRWTADTTSYRFWRQQADGNWLEIHNNDTLRQRKLPDGMAISALRTGTSYSQVNMRLEFVPYAPSALFTVELSLGEIRARVSSSVLGDVRIEPTDVEGEEANAASR